MHGHVERASDGVPMGQDGAKLDAGKSPVLANCFHYFPNALRAVAAVSQAGIDKGYAAGSWKSVKDGVRRYGEALSRHLLDEHHSLYDDAPGGIHTLHAAQVAWNALARLELLLNQGVPLYGPNKSSLRKPNTEPGGPGY